MPEEKAELLAELLTANDLRGTFSHGTQLPAIPRSLIRGIVERDAITSLGIDAIITPRVPVGIDPAEAADLPEEEANR